MQNVLTTGEAHWANIKVGDIWSTDLTLRAAPTTPPPSQCFYSPAPPPPPPPSPPSPPSPPPLASSRAAPLFVKRPCRTVHTTALSVNQLHSRFPPWNFYHLRRQKVVLKCTVCTSYCVQAKKIRHKTSQEFVSRASVTTQAQDFLVFGLKKLVVEKDSALVWSQIKTPRYWKFVLLLVSKNCQKIFFTRWWSCVLGQYRTLWGGSFQDFVGYSLILLQIAWTMP